jgi:hypothetical protein
VLHDDHFPPTTPDVEWLKDVGARNWVLLSKDFAISRNALERLALFDSGVRAFLLSQQELSGPQMADALATALRRMRHIARDEAAPFVARVSASGAVTVLTALKREWKRLRRKQR